MILERSCRAMKFGEQFGRLTYSELDWCDSDSHVDGPLGIVLGSLARDELEGRRNGKRYVLRGGSSAEGGLEGGVGGGESGHSRVLGEWLITCEGSIDPCVSASRIHCATWSFQDPGFSERISTVSERQSSLLFWNEAVECSAMMTKCGDRFRMNCEKRRVDVGFVKLKTPKSGAAGSAIWMTC